MLANKGCVVQFALLGEGGIVEGEGLRERCDHSKDPAFKSVSCFQDSEGVTLQLILHKLEGPEKDRFVILDQANANDDRPGIHGIRQNG